MTNLNQRRTSRGSVALYCPQHNVVEHFTPGEVERIVYALSGAEADARCESNGSDRISAGEDPVFEVECLRSMLDSSYDIEGYGEWTNAFIDCRREAARVR